GRGRMPIEPQAVVQRGKALAAEGTMIVAASHTEFPVLGDQEPLAPANEARRSRARGAVDAVLGFLFLLLNPEALQLLAQLPFHLGERFLHFSERPGTLGARRKAFGDQLARQLGGSLTQLIPISRLSHTCLLAGVGRLRRASFSGPPMTS